MVRGSSPYLGEYAGQSTCFRDLATGPASSGLKPESCPMSILHTATRIALGATIAGAGLSLGRDLYKGGKRDIGSVILLIVVLSVLYGIYKSGVWIAQNYPQYGGAGKVLAHTLALLLSVFCYGTLFAVLAALDAEIAQLNAPPLFPIAEFTQHPLYEPFMAEFLTRIYTFDTVIGNITIAQTALLALGLIVGLSKRKKRQLAWEAEIHNRKFFAQHGLQSIQDDRLRDNHNIGYRLENALSNELEFKVAGQRGKRAYLKFDSTGKYTSWSGVVMQR